MWTHNIVYLISVAKKNKTVIMARSINLAAIGDCLHCYLQNIIITWLFVHMSGNKQSIWKYLGHVKQLGHVYRLHEQIHLWSNFLIYILCLTKIKK